MTLGAQLFAKRRKRSEKWVVDETNVKRSDALDTLGDFSTKPFSTTPTTVNSQFMPPPSFIDRSRIQHAQKLNEIQVAILLNKRIGVLLISRFRCLGTFFKTQAPISEIALGSSFGDWISGHSI